jgi:HEPN domain-containing protein
MRDRLVRMCREAKDRLHDAAILAASIDTRSDSQALLRVLAFEVLLKAALLAASGRPPRNVHKYADLWRQLPAPVQAEVLAFARARMAGHTDLSDVEKLLKWFQFVFVNTRYHYELYDGYTLAEQRELGELWENLGAPTEEAIVQYHPLELQCLTEGLLAYVEKML